jgi:kumamolisin
VRSAVFAVSALVALTLAGATPALAAPAATPAQAPVPGSAVPRALPVGEQRVDLALTPRDPVGLSKLAKRTVTLTPALREARRQEALPGTARATETATQAEALGLTVLSTTDTSVSVAGSPALVLSLFGSARANRASLPTAQALPDLPPSLTGLVLVAAGGDETRPSRRQHNRSDGSLTQAEFQSVYDVPRSTTPPAANAPTVATLQFAKWKPADLTSYVGDQRIYGNSSYDPIADGGFSSVIVDGGPTDFNGSGEVSLDQEAIATMAPGLRQRAYFTGQTSALAQANAVNKVAADAMSQHILTLSSSWGNCEADAYYGASDRVLQADLNSINNVLAAGVTFFAASGDSGSVDCPDTHPGVKTVDVPAALPNVVSVGGTSVQTGPSGTTQTVWNNGAFGGATGGGYSSLFARPTYQDATLANANRGVPDIAMDGDPSTGLAQYDSTPGGCGGSCAGSPVGGTSLSAPLAAASLASVLASRGATIGKGDIHQLLYDASSANWITDVTSGNNGGYGAGPGWDATTGLGAPRWSSLIANAKPSSAESFVTAAYEDYIGRAPTPDELAYGLLIVGDASSIQKRAQFTTALAQSDTYLGAVVNKLYLDTLGRTGDPGGVAYWTNELRSGRVTVAQTAGLFYASPEYFSGYGNNDLTTWVTDLYHKVLLRNPDQGGLNYYVKLAQDTNRYTVAYPFYQSLESSNTRVKALYLHFLQRPADQGGLDYWANKIPALGDVALASNLTLSTEYLSKAATRYP